MTQFTLHNVDTAPEQSKELVQTVLNENGYIPNLIGLLANAPSPP